MVAARLDYDPFTEGGRRLLRCKIVADGDGLRAGIEELGPAGEVDGKRTLSSPGRTCRDLTQALVLVLSLAARAPGLDSPDGDAHPAPLISSLPVPVAADEGPSSSPTTGGSPPPPAQHFTFQVGFGLYATDRSLPEPSWGAVVIAGAGRKSASVSLEIAAEAPQALVLIDGQATVWQSSTSLVPCWRWMMLMTCGLAEGGLVHGEGEGIPGARAGIQGWLATGARIGGWFPLRESLALEVRTDFVVPLLRTQLRVADTTIWTMPEFSAILGLSVVHTFR
jgi:hypothetical protein